MPIQVPRAGASLMGYHKNDPRVIKTRFNSKCSACKKSVPKGEEAFYWPIGSSLKCIPCGQPDYSDFLLSVQDEDNYRR